MSYDAASFKAGFALGRLLWRPPRAKRDIPHTLPYAPSMYDITADYPVTYGYRYVQWDIKEHVGASVGGCVLHYMMPVTDRNFTNWAAISNIPGVVFYPTYYDADGIKRTAESYAINSYDSASGLWYRYRSYAGGTWALNDSISILVNSLSEALADASRRFGAGI